MESRRGEIQWPRTLERKNHTDHQRIIQDGRGNRWEDARTGLNHPRGGPAGRSDGGFKRLGTIPIGMNVTKDEGLAAAVNRISQSYGGVKV